MPENRRKRSHIKALLAFAFLLALVASYSVYLWNIRDQIEYPDFPTAIEDPRLYDDKAIELSDQFWKPMLYLKGKGLYRRQFQPAHIEASYMIRKSADDSGQYNLYQHSEDKQEGIYYLKLSQNSFLRIGPQKYFPQDGAPDAESASAPETD